ncbi:MAG: Coenzyme F420 hydrogenase/dehydrogenase, beta subunit C-terminal domain, partial [Actinomycetota bacterium]|nr:Coenzyme F420 hydrogenase/dehydrogenase, beta subunit C-terminal domain [Actinomycetota bacterium]
IKGVFQVWTKDGGYHEINLKECHAWTREGCNHCPDFAAEHADISTGGIGNETDWTLTIVRTELGRAVIDAMVKDGAIETRPGDDDPGAIALMHRLAENSRKRWPDWAQPAAKVGISAKPAG